MVEKMLVLMIPLGSHWVAFVTPEHHSGEVMHLCDLSLLSDDSESYAGLQKVFPFKIFSLCFIYDDKEKLSGTCHWLPEG